MPVVTRRRLSRNPGIRRTINRRNSGKRRLTLRQKLAGFGGKRVQAAAKASRRRRNTGTPRRRARRNVEQGYYDSTGFHPIRASSDYSPSRAGEGRKKRKATTKQKRATARRKTVKRAAPRRKTSTRKNVGEILSVIPISNPSTRRKTVARTRRRTRRATPRRRRNYGYVRHRRRNYGRRRAVASRRRNSGRRIRRNPSIPQPMGIIGGAMLTSVVSGMASRWFPQASSGPMRWVTTGLTALLVGQGVGRVTKNRPLGNQITQGGMVLLALQVMGDLAPGLMGSLPIGLQGRGRGVGIIAPSSFYSPQVPVPGSMTQFLTPAATRAAITRYAPVPVARNGMAGRGRYAR